ncbi:MAG: VWA domain-containing protein [Bowdeniella nasicola]|nr:VWA domain-containing protein [Bowdeniella nasicola]
MNIDTHVLSLPPLAWPPVGLIGAVAVVLAAGAGWWWRRRHPGTPVLVAHTEFLPNLPAYRTLLAGRRTKLATAIAAFLLAGLTAALLAARPVSVHTESEKLATRDIVLCLDVSGSMLSYDAEIVEKFQSMVDSFRGERIALVLWNSTARTVFPLTDDYSMIRNELTEITRILDTVSHSLQTSDSDLDEVFDLLAGTASLDGQSASLIGDGLANCVLAFDLADQQRSRSIIFATDNELAGTPVYYLDEAARFARERDIAVLGLYVGGQRSDAAALRADFERDLTNAGGKVFDTHSPETVDEVIDQITSTQVAELDAHARSVQTDEPYRYAPILVVATLVGLAAVGWWRL